MRSVTLQINEYDDDDEQICSAADTVLLVHLLPVNCQMHHTIKIFDTKCFLPRNAMLARYTLSSVCPSYASIVSKRLNSSPDSTRLPPKISAKFQWGHPKRGRQTEVV